MAKKILGKKTEKKAIKANRPVRADWKEGVKKKQVGVSDMTLLTKITNEAINDNLQKRWQNAEIYTYIGHVLISVNPFRDLGIYTDDILASYKGKNLLEMPPHVFAVAESSYHHMNSYKENQCIIISGESGAGKTEAAKRIMQYIAAVSGNGQNSSIKEIKEMVLATNPLLESFGCAKTLRNDNSSRHGKYLEIQFNSQGEPVGAVITNYLLEKNRVVGQIDNERNFHIFYQLTKAAPQEYQQSFGIQGPDSYLYTSKSNCLDVNGINDIQDFQETLNAMNIIGLQKHEQDEIFKILAVILWLGNIIFVEDDNGHSMVSDADVANFIAYLMEVDAESLTKALTSRVMETQRGGRRGSIYEVPLNMVQAIAVRDALAKSLYERLFEWIVMRVNISLQSRSSHQYTMGVLDIYGFEIFEENSFEQMCINYVNEKLQQIFIELTLKAEQEEYVREQIQWTPIKFFNNKVVCDLIEEKRPPGIFAALNDACATAHADSSAADNSFVQRLGFLSSNPHFESRGSKFLIRHYAGDVLYNVEGMTDKNKDSLLKDLLNLATSSTNSFISNTLFPERMDPNSKKRPPTAGDKIKASCNTLVTKLMQCHPSYIRTIKSNDNRSATEYDEKRVLHQIQYLGLCENIRVRRAGFAYRTTFDKFVERFYLLCPTTGYAGEYIWNKDARSGALEILKYNNIPTDEWQMGTTKVFIRHPETIFALESLRDKYWHNMATRIQRAWRAYVRYKIECAKKIQRFWRQNKYNIGYLQMREYGHQILGGQKERRRFSLVSMRRFTGDYLDIKSGSGLSTMIRNAISFKPNEKVIFSMRGSILVPRAMRSSIPSPRTFVLTNQNLHIIMATKNGKTLSMIDEKILSLNIINGMSVSTLQDDWVVLHVDSFPDGDVILSCTFKTELLAHISQQTGGRIQVSVVPQIQYKKKGGKSVTMKFIKDETAKGDGIYKSHVVKICSGAPPGSQSAPPCAVKARPTKSTTARSTPRKMNTRNVPTPKANIQSTLENSGRVMPTNHSASLPPPAPPLPPSQASTKPQYKVIYPYSSQQPGDIMIEPGDILEIITKEETGWWLARKDQVEGWVPSNYLEEYTPPVRTMLPPPPPPPPSRRAPPAVPKTESASTVPHSAAITTSVSNTTTNGIPAWKQELMDARQNKSAVNGTPVPAARKAAPPTPGPKPVVPKSKPTVPARPGTAPTPAPRAPPRNNGTSSSAAASLADALRARRQHAVQDDDDDDEW
ncbi:P-loop containing nucleoside triphosphate hydrolase protein [Cokeromyces recurvatus]|uniref:P-loop containing nucleoside triphosphate hydrolase protein n=1 Tax=Cokeromyces recurvatus TaxID=90255 RepID=UPI0022200E85|nr:P-loop containing nucleoside triphosphate hydrolase protein [Cokeromyces recurvatus]KAI7904550.1 P-loop containing nucleoside triphosphate hydrolase protein [Cokeromyces recurvatus]